MIEQAKEQLRDISVSQIREVLKQCSPESFDKMIIEEGQLIKRADFIFTKLMFEKVERKVEKLRFPLYDVFRDEFTRFEGGSVKFGSKALFDADELLDTLRRRHEITGEECDVNDISEPFDYPLDQSNAEIAKDQRKYFFPDLTYQEVCEECSGEKYVKCSSKKCDGRHNWSCTDCRGDGKVSCGHCVGDGKVSCQRCKGIGNVKCGSLVGSNLVGGLTGSSLAGCNGKGVVYVDGGNYANGKSKPRKEKRCGQCRGKGEVPCKNCASKGEVKCDDCSGRGEVRCLNCSGKGDITCSVCYGDTDRYGRVDCSGCGTMGKVSQVVYVSSLVSHNAVERIFLKGEKLVVSDDVILGHVNSKAKCQLVYRSLDNHDEHHCDEFGKEFVDIFEKDCGISKDEFPLVTKEELYYQVIPCIELSYKHMLTNTTHEFLIIDFWTNPEVIFLSEPESLKQDFGNIAKSVGGLFGKIFKTKAFKTKEDRRNEITLLIYLAKADGKIDEEEKVSLSREIVGLKDFTNSEKQSLFNLMNALVLPPLTKKDVIFSTKERTAEVLSKLIDLAMVDGDFDDAEKALIEEIKNLQ